MALENPSDIREIAQRRCPHCQAIYVSPHRFCSHRCRRDNWEARQGNRRSYGALRTAKGDPR